MPDRDDIAATVAARAPWGFPFERRKQLALEVLNVLADEDYIVAHVSEFTSVSSTGDQHHA